MKIQRWLNGKHSRKYSAEKESEKKLNLSLVVLKISKEIEKFEISVHFYIENWLTIHIIKMFISEEFKCDRDMLVVFRLAKKNTHI